MADDALISSVTELIKKRDDIEEQLKALQDVLKSHGVGMKEPLVDEEGFPKSDLDVYTIRHTRKTIICLQGDYKILTNEIEQAIHEIHSMAKDKQQHLPPDVEIDLGADLSAFLLFDVVVEGSPAHKGGVLVGDKVLKFGSITSKNFDGLRSIADVIQQSKGHNMPIIVERDGKQTHLSVFPDAWSGKGLFGCNFTIIK